MSKRYLLIICVLVIIILLCVSCENKENKLIEQPDGTFLWNGLELIRDDFRWYNRGTFSGVSVPENVITTEDKTLTVFFRSYDGGDEYGVKEYIRVNIDGIWYTINQQISQYDENDTLVLLGYQGDRRDYREWEGEKYTVDLSVLGKLPVGAYLFIETFYDSRFKEERHAFANFWIIKPGGKRPPESETTGKAREEDIVLYARSIYEARRDITDKDVTFYVAVENISGKSYSIENEREKKDTWPVLEIQKNNKDNKWGKIEYPHINAGLVSGWTTDYNEVFLYEPLSAGHYRIRIPMQVFKNPESTEREPGYIEVICEFDVIAYSYAPEPKWEISRLMPSPYETSEQSTGIKMTAVNPVLNKNNTKLELTLTAYNIYEYGEPYQVEILIDDKWYCVPFSNGGFNMLAYMITPEDSEKTFNCNPVFACGILPAGQYRITKEFDLWERMPEGEERWSDVFVAKEFAFAEFTVEEMLGTEDERIESIKEAYPKEEK